MADIKDTIYFFNREQEEMHAMERAKKLNVPYINLSNYPLVKEILDMIPEELAIKYRAIPYLKIGKQTRIGIIDPGNLEAMQAITEQGQRVNTTFIPSLISQSSFYYGIAFYEKIKQDQSVQQQAVEEKKAKVFEITDINSAAKAAKLSNTTELLEVLLSGASALNSSDIHLEPFETGFLVRFRIDGILQNITELPIPQYKQLLSRIKFLSKLRMDKVNEPQDGSFSLKIREEDIDFRVSIMPSAYGESVVLRLLGQEKAILDLDKLGFRSDALREIKAAISKPHGMILTSGPTGSGKTSTLYAILVNLKKPGVKIITLEDPIEYKMDGIEQSQVRPDQDYTFATGLRASLRQDPDILMVGEIRDQETAEIAIQAALTGHLLLSTIHANSAPAVYARFLEIGVKPFLLSGSINLIMAQRLVRKNCPYCLEEYQIKPEDWQGVRDALANVMNRLPAEFIALLDQPGTGKRGRGCEKCNNTGFQGRQVIVEVLTPSEKIEALIARSATISEFEKTAREVGMISMEQDGLIKAIQGTTTVEEIWRVTRG